LSAAAEEWIGEDVGLADVERALGELRVASAEGTEGPDLRTSVMTHLAWVPKEWREAAMDTLAGLEERHPSRGILLFPEPSAADGIDAKVSVLAFPLRGERRHVAAEVIQLTLRGQCVSAPASIVTPLLMSDLPVFLRWRGELPFGARELEQMLGVCDRLVVDSLEWKDPAAAYRELEPLFEQTAVSDIAWRRTLPWRRVLAGLWPEIGEAGELRVTGPLAEALLLVGWLRSRLGKPCELLHEESPKIESVAVDGKPVSVSSNEKASSSDLLSAELDELSRDPIYEDAVRAAG
jgi:glucose-6-phosphate dehydrogenase assembly protein OpcA